MQSRSDEQLMTRVQGGDIEAFEELVERHKAVVYSLAYGMLRSREDAEEAAQDTFIKLFRAREQFDPARKLEPWLLRIAGNTCRDMLRRRKVELLQVATTDDGEEIARRVADPKSLGRDWTDATQQAVQHELAQLSDKLRLPLLLKYVNGFTNQQIADALEISVSNVKVRMARAKDVLQSRLDEVLES